MVQFYVDNPTNIFFVRTTDDVPTGFSWDFNHPFSLLLNLAVGGTGSWPGPPGYHDSKPGRDAGRLRASLLGVAGDRPHDDGALAQRNRRTERIGHDQFEFIRGLWPRLLVMQHQCS